MKNIWRVLLQCRQKGLFPPHIIQNLKCVYGSTTKVLFKFQYTAEHSTTKQYYDEYLILKRLFNKRSHCSKFKCLTFKSLNDNVYLAIYFLNINKKNLIQNFRIEIWNENFIVIINNKRNLKFKYFFNKKN